MGGKWHDTLTSLTSLASSLSFPLLQEELELKGFKYLGGPADADHRVELKPGFRLDQDPDVGRTLVFRTVSGRVV